MKESISIEHKIQYFCVTKEPEIIRSKSGKSVMLTEGACTTELPRTCPECGGTLHVHDHRHVFIQDLELFGNLSLLKVGYARMECRYCEAKSSQEVPFRVEHHMLTTRLETRVCRRLNQEATLKATSISLGIHPSIIKEIDKERLRGRGFLTRPEYAASIGIDEFLLHKGHRYATVVIDLDRKRVIFLEEGRKKEQAEHFIRRMGPAWMSHVKAVSMDMNAQYDSAFRESAPHVAIVYDRFHMVKLFNDPVLTAIRRRLQNECDENKDGEGFKLLKGSRFILLTSPQKLREKEAAVENNERLRRDYISKGLPVPPGERLMRTGFVRKLETLLFANGELNVAYLLLDQFKYAYDVDSMDVMMKELEQWHALARQSDVPEILRFSQTLKSHQDGLVNRVIHKISSGAVEGINTMIKSLRRTAYGFRDTEYFFLKVMFESLKPRLRYLSPKILS